MTNDIFMQRAQIDCVWIKAALIWRYGKLYRHVIMARKLFLALQCVAVINRREESAAKSESGDIYYRKPD